MLDVDQAGELKAAFRRGNWTNGEIKQLSEGDVLANVRQVILGHAEIKVLEHVVDCDVKPVILGGWTIEEHRKGGRVKIERRGDDLYVDGVKIDLFLTDAQKKGSIVGNSLRTELSGKPVLNACILDYLLAHPHLIPESWKKDENGNTRYIFFWGTIFRCSGVGIYVWYLYWLGGRWLWHCRWLDNGFGDQDPAALRAS